MIINHELAEAASGMKIVALSKMDPEMRQALKEALDGDNPIIAKGALIILAHASMLDSRDACMPQVDALINAGWLFEPVYENSEPWQWAWRRPKRRAKSKGMRFASTNQAYQALRKENPELPEIYQ